MTHYQGVKFRRWLSYVSHIQNKFMQKHTIVGIDVSSATLDICIKKDGKLQSLVIENQN